MSLLDLIILALLIWGIYSGFKEGLLLQAATLIALFIALIGTLHYSDHIAGLLKQHFEIPLSILPAISMIICFFSIIVICNTFASALHRLMHNIALGWADHLAGGILGGIKYLLIIGVCLSLVTRYDKQEVITTQDFWQKSKILKPIDQTVSLCLQWIDWEKTIDDIQKQIERGVVPTTISERNTEI